MEVYIKATTQWFNNNRYILTLTYIQFEFKNQNNRHSGQLVVGLNFYPDK